MHELSIADALAGQVERHAPPGRVVTVEIRAGALRGLEPEALRLCWEAVTRGTRMADSELRIESLPWTLDCGACGRRWTGPEAFDICTCGNPVPVPSAGDELDLVSISVDRVEGAGVSP